jgi:hypothetical protein
MAAIDPLRSLEVAFTVGQLRSGRANLKELVIPPAAQRDADSWELMRTWVAENGLHCSLNIGVYEAQGIPEEKAWGTILADAARHVSNALASSGHGDADTTLREIRRIFEDELDSPTSKTKGEFVQ